MVDLKVGKVYIKIPNDLDKTEIEKFTFAFSRITLSSKHFIQFFEPIALSKTDVARGPQKITFTRAEVEKNKSEMIREFINDKSRPESVEIGYHSLSPNFYVIRIPLRNSAPPIAPSQLTHHT